MRRLWFLVQVKWNWSPGDKVWPKTLKSWPFGSAELRPAWWMEKNEWERLSWSWWPVWLPLLVAASSPAGEAAECQCWVFYELLSTKLPTFPQAIQLKDETLVEQLLRPNHRKCTHKHTQLQRKKTHTHTHLRVNLCVFLRPTAACRLNAVSTLTVVYNIYLPLRQQLTSGKTKTQTAFTRIRAGLLTVWPSLSVYCHSDQRGRHPHNTGPAYQRSEDSDLWMHTGLHEGHQGETMAVPHNLAPPPSPSYPPLSSSQKLAC